MAIDTSELRKAIEEKKLILEDKYAVVQVAARKVKERYKELIVAEEKRDLRNGSKEIAKHEMAESSFKLAMKEYFYFSDIYNSLVDSIITLYENLIASDCVKGAKKAGIEAKRFEEKERYRREKIADSIANIGSINEIYADYISEESKKNNRTDENLQVNDMKNQMNTERFLNSEPAEDIRESSHGSRSAEESVSVDITGIIENAVSAAMDKFNAVLEMRTNKIMESEAEKAPVQPMPENGSEDILKMHSELVGFELEIAAKLSVLTQKLKDLSDGLIEIGVSCIELSNTQHAVAQKQKETAEIQHALLRDMQDTASKQRLIEEGYSLASKEQSAIFELQRANSENQSMLAESQKALNQIQMSITKSHGALAEANGEIFDSQNKLTEMQHTVMAAQAKNLEQQRALTEKQAEISAMQKNAFSEHKEVKKKLKKSGFMS